MKIGIYPGSFDPVTKGHLDIIERSAKMVDKLFVAVLNNNTKSPLFSVDERVNMLCEVTKDIPNVQIDAFSGLLVDYAKKRNATIIIRGCVQSPILNMNCRCPRPTGLWMRMWIQSF